MGGGDGLVGLLCEGPSVASDDGGGMGRDPNGLVHSKMDAEVFIWRSISQFGLKIGKKCYML